MFVCTSGRIDTYTKGGKHYYVGVLNLKDDEAKTRKERYAKHRVYTDYLVGGKTNGIKNETLANVILAEAQKEFTPVGSTMQFNKYCEYWLAEKKKDKDLSLTTVEGYEYKLQYLIDYFKDIDLTLHDVTTQHLRDFQNSLYEVDKKYHTQRNEQGLSDRTIRDIMVLTKQVFTFAKDNGHLLGANPSASLKLPKKKTVNDDRPFIDESQAEVFFQALSERCNADNKTIFYALFIGLYYGLRREEICGLRWSAIRDGAINIEHTVTRMRTLVERDEAKTEAGNRCLAVTPEIQAVLDDIRQIQKENRNLLKDTYVNTDYVFTWRSGKPYSPDYYTKTFRKTVDSCDELDKRLHLHDLRASCVSILIGRGATIKDVQKYVGHKDIQTTMNIYARTNKDRQNLMAETMAKALSVCTTGERL